MVRPPGAILIRSTDYHLANYLTYLFLLQVLHSHNRLQQKEPKKPLAPCHLRHVPPTLIYARVVIIIIISCNSLYKKSSYVYVRVVATRFQPEL